VGPRTVLAITLILAIAAACYLLTATGVLRVHFKTWCNRFSVSVKVTISHLGFLHFGSVLFSLRFPNGSFEMHS
jgi:hypothetical protein